MGGHVSNASGLVRPTFVLDAAQSVFDPIVANNRITKVACGG
jgi:hypothetical protein